MYPTLQTAVLSFRIFLPLVVAIGFGSLGEDTAHAAPLGVMNFSAAVNGGTAISTGGTAANAHLAIDGVIPASGSTLNAATWVGANGYVTGATWVGTLAPEAPDGNVTQIRVYDRGCCASVAPYSIELLNASNSVIYSDSHLSNSPQQRPAVFNVPNLSGATKVRLTNLGAGTGDAYLHEVEVIGINNHVGGAGNISSLSLDPTISGTTTPGNLANARVVQLELTSSTGQERADISEFRVFDTGANNVALSSAGAVGFHRDDASTIGGITTAGQGPLLNDNNTSTFSDSLGGIGDFYGVTLAANTSINSLETVNRGDCCSPARTMRREVFSDTARTNLIYTDEVSFAGTNGAITNLPFQLGGLATASMNDGQTYIFELDAVSNTSDTLVVNQAQATSTALVFDGDLVVRLLNGVPEVGEVFQLFEADSFSGTFDSITLPTLEKNLVWNLDDLFVNGTLSIGAVPEPSSLTLLGMLGLGCMAARRRHCRRQA